MSHEIIVKFKIKQFKNILSAKKQKVKLRVWDRKSVCEDELKVFLIYEKLQSILCSQQFGILMEYSPVVTRNQMTC